MRSALAIMLLMAGLWSAPAEARTYARCPNGTFAPKNRPCPTPTPTPAPTQTAATWPSDAISGLGPIASEFDFNLALQPAWGTGAIPPSAAPDVVGAMRFICGAGQLLYDDPIVFPGQPGKSHLHQFYGNTGANAYSTYQSLRTTGQSTCANGAYPGNRTPYWTAAMLDGKGHVVQPDWAALYYKRHPLNDPKCSLTGGDPQAEGNCVPIPNGLRMIFGFNMLNPTAPVTGATHWDCQGPGAVGGHYADIPSAVAQGHCGTGDQLLAVQDAPECWDGHNLDATDHRSHVGYPGYGDWGYLKCDPQHPFVIPAYHLAVAYSIEAGDDLNLWHLSSDEMFPALAHGSTLHGDYGPAAWDNNIETMFTQGCIDRMLNCSGGDLGNGKQLIGASQPSYGWKNPKRLVPVPAGGM